jgi:hypothetical protein
MIPGNMIPNIETWAEKLTICRRTRRATRGPQLSRCHQTILARQADLNVRYRTEPYADFFRNLSGAPRLSLLNKHRSPKSDQGERLGHRLAGSAQKSVCMLSFSTIRFRFVAGFTKFADVVCYVKLDCMIDNFDN